MLFCTLYATTPLLTYLFFLNLLTVESVLATFSEPHHSFTLIRQDAMPAAKNKPISSLSEPRKATRIVQKVFIPAPPEKVYAAYLDGKNHSAMTGASAQL